MVKSEGTVAKVVSQGAVWVRARAGEPWVRVGQSRAVSGARWFFSQVLERRTVWARAGSLGSSSNNNNNLFTYNAQASIYIFTCAELKFIKKTNYKYII